VRLFLPALAVVVGPANALLYNAFGNSPWGGPFVWKLQFGPMFTAHMLSTVLLDEREPMPQGMEILYDTAIPTVAGGILGSIEGVAISLPLAWLLGIFGDRTAARTRSR